jgi:ADP-ribosylglycohydrolase
MRDDVMVELEAAVGPEVVRSLRQRRLLWTVAPMGRTTAAVEVRGERLAGVVAGLRGGAADEAGLDVQSFALSAATWLDHGWRAPAALGEQLSRELHVLRMRGEAVSRAVEAFRAGAPWYLAADGSHGHAALARAVAAGAVFTRDVRAASLAGSADAAVTHAEPVATASAAALASTIAALVTRPDGMGAIEVVAHVARSIGEPHVALAMRRAFAAAGDGGLPGCQAGTVRAVDTLELALWSALAHPDPRAAVDVAREMASDSATAGAVAGALSGAIHGAAALPVAWRDDVEGAASSRALLARLLEHDAASDEQPGGSDIWFLLDRSGSMSAIAHDVVAGFDRFFAGQREAGGEAAVTIVQFDGDEPHEVLVDAAPIAAVPSLAGRFEPRGMTPLYDAVGLLLDRAEQRGGADADQLVVVLTDGEENASRRWTQRTLFERIETLRARGWTFVFLGANQDSYASGGAVGFQAGNVSNFEASADGVHAAYDGLERTVSAWRGKSRALRRRDRDDFWGGRKEAEER